MLLIDGPLAGNTVDLPDRPPGREIRHFQVEYGSGHSEVPLFNEVPTAVIYVVDPLTGKRIVDHPASRRGYHTYEVTGPGEARYIG